MKRCRFYEYLISYGGPQNSFAPLSESKSVNKNLTNTLFFPSILDSPECRESLDETITHSTTVFDNDAGTDEKMLSTTQDFKFGSTRIKEAFRPAKKVEVKNIDQLVAKSLTPSIRIKKPGKQSERNRSLTIG